MTSRGGHNPKGQTKIERLPFSKALENLFFILGEVYQNAIRGHLFKRISTRDYY